MKYQHIPIHKGRELKDKEEKTKTQRKSHIEKNEQKKIYTQEQICNALYESK